MNRLLSFKWKTSWSKIVAIVTFLASVVTILAFFLALQPREPSTPGIPAPFYTAQAVIADNIKMQTDVQIALATAQAKLLVQTSGPTATAVAGQLESLRATATAAAAQAKRLAPTATAVAIVERQMTGTPAATGVLTSTALLTLTATLTPTPTKASPVPTVPPTATVVPTPTPSELDQIPLVSLPEFAVAITATLPSTLTGDLAAAWLWQQGDSTQSRHELEVDGDTINLIAGPNTDLWDYRTSAPKLLFPLTGDFQVQILMAFMPKSDWQAAGILFMDPAAPDNRVELRRDGDGGGRQTVSSTSTVNQRSKTILSLPYAKDHLYLRVSREGDRWSFAASENGVNWMDLGQDEAFSLPPSMYAGLYAYSTRDAFADAAFTDLRLGQPMARQLAAPTGEIAFLADRGPDSLPRAWSWYPGASAASSFAVKDDAIKLVAGPNTNAWHDTFSVPHLDLPATGDFSVQARFAFDSQDRGQQAGILVRPRTGFDNYVALRRHGGSANEQQVSATVTQDRSSRTLNFAPYAKSVTYLQVSREDAQWSFRVSENGRNWFTLSDRETFPLADEVYISFFVLSTSPAGVAASLSEVQIEQPPQWIAAPVYAGALPFADPSDPKQLSPVWGWYPGGQEASDMVVADEGLTIVAAPGTVLYHDRITAPWVEVPVSGNFTSQVHVSFMPELQEHAAGFLFRAHDSMAERLDFRRISGSGGEQKVDAMATTNNSSQNLGSVPFAATDFYLRVQREGSLMQLSYSEDGAEWTDLLKDYVTTLPEDIEVALMGFANAEQGISATFTDLRITQP